MESLLCPECHVPLLELSEDFESMTEGQESDYLMGGNHTFQCPKCNQVMLRDVAINEPELDEWEDLEGLSKALEINPDTCELLIEHAIKSWCFIEATSLIHNTIEGYLINRIKNKVKDDSVKTAQLKKMLNEQVYLMNFAKYCLFLDLINDETFEKLRKFNNGRVLLIHKLLKQGALISEVIDITRQGRELQIYLSPLFRSEKDIEDVMKMFDELIKWGDPERAKKD